MVLSTGGATLTRSLCRTSASQLSLSLGREDGVVEDVLFTCFPQASHDVLASKLTPKKWPIALSKNVSRKIDSQSDVVAF